MKITILVGNIASGKSTYIRDNWEEGTFLISKDDHRKAISSYKNKDYIWDETLEEFIHDIILDCFEAALYLNIENIILDETNMAIETRAPYVMLAMKYGYELEAIVFPDYGEGVHVERRMSDNHGKECSEEMWREVYNRKKDRYEEPSIEEGFNNIIFIEGN